MTTETLRVGIDVTDNGSTAKVTNEAVKLNAALEKAQRTASQTSAVKYAKAPANSSAMAQAAPESDGASYRQAKGIANATGAEGRDFARQAQGLGGLVHVYATFAANLFAVSAAFTALSKAADTTNMVKGLDQLGAAQGLALGSLAKNLTKVTDGAISLRDAMAATAQASAGGLSGDQLTRLTVVAKNASQALGRDMSDALTRLTRGVVKIEPELLDELGIMVRVDRAAQDYARTLGKTASSLTEFEKRQSFAVAVIEQGEKKFNSIQLDANPFNKLLASMTNLSLAGGELLNKVLGPIAKLLSESPMALSAAMAGIAGMLLSKAIPAISQWRTGLAEAAIQAKVTAESLNDKLVDYRVSKDLGPGNQMLKEAALYKQGALEIAQQNKHIIGSKSELYQMMKSSETSALDLFTKSIGMEMSRRKEIEKTSNALKSTTDPTQITFLQTKLAALQKEEKIYAAINVELEKYVALNNKANTLLDAGVAKSSKKATILDEDYYREKNAQAAKNKATRIGLTSSLANSIPEMGITDSWKKFTAGVNDSANGLSRLQKAGTLARGAMTVVASGLELVMGTLSRLIPAFFILTMAFELFDSLLSTSSKQVEAFSQSLDVLDGAAKTAGDTIDAYNRKSDIDKSSIESVKAMANAFNGVTDAANQSVKTFLELKNSMSGWDKSIDFIKTLWSGDYTSKFKESTSKALLSGMKVIQDPDLRKKYNTNLRELFKVDAGKEINTESISKGIDSLLKQGYGLEEIGIRLKEVNKDIQEQASAAESLGNSLTNTYKELSTLTNSLIPQDAASKVGLGFINSMRAIRDAAKGPIIELKALIDITNDLNKLQALPPSFATALLNNAQTLKDFDKQLLKLDKDLEMMHKREVELTKDKDGISAWTFFWLGAEESIKRSNKALLELKNTQAGIKGANTQREDLVGNIKKAVDTLNTEMSKGFVEGAKLLEKGLANAIAKAAIDFNKTVLASIPDVPGKASAEADLARQEIAIQMSLIESNFELKLQMEKTRLTWEKTQLQTAKAEAEKEPNEGLRKVKLDANTASIKANEDMFGNIDKILNTPGSKAQATQKLLEGVMKSANADNAYLQNQASSLYTAALGAAQQAAALSGQLNSIKFSEIIKGYKEQEEATKRILDNSLSQLSINQQGIDIAYKEAEIKGTVYWATKEQAILEENILNTKKLEATLVREQQVLSEALASGANKELVERARIQSLTNANIEKQKLDQKTLNDLSQLNTNKLLDQDKIQARTLDRHIKEIEYKNELLKIESEIGDIALDKQAGQVDFMEKLGMISDLDATIAKANIDQQKNLNKFKTESFTLEMEREKLISNAKKKRNIEELKQIQTLSQAMALSAKIELASIENKPQMLAELQGLITSYKEIREKIDDINKEEKNGNNIIDQKLVKLEKETELRGAALQQAKDVATYDKYVAPFMDAISTSLSDALYEGFENGAAAGGKKFIDSLKETLKKAALKVVIDATVNTIMGDIKNMVLSALTGGGTGGTGTSILGTAGNLASTGSGLYQAYQGFTTGNGTGIMGNVGNWAGNALGTYGTGSAATVTTANMGAGGQFVTTGMGNEAALWASQAGGTTSTTAAAGTGTSALGGAATALGWMAVAYMVLEYLDSKAGGAKIEGDAFMTTKGKDEPTFSNTFADGQSWYTRNSALAYEDAEGNTVDTNNMMSLYWLDSTNKVTKTVEDSIKDVLIPFGKSVKSFIGTLGGTTEDLTFGLGFNTDPAGTAPDNVSGGVANAAGETIYRNTYDTDRGGSAAAMAIELDRMMLAAVKASDVPKIFRDFIDIDKIKTMTKDEVAEVVKAISSLKPLIVTFTAIGVSGDNVTKTLIDMMGGIDTAQQKLNAYYDNFFAKEIILGKNMGALTAEFDNLDIAMPKTREGFSALVSSLDLTTEAGMQMFNSLMNLSPAFASITEGWDTFIQNFIPQATLTSRKIADAQSTISRIYTSGAIKVLTDDGTGTLAAQSVIGLSEALKTLGLEVPTTREGFGRVAEALKEMGPAGQGALEALLGIAPAFDTMATAAEGIINVVAGISARIADMKFQMEFDTKDKQGQYAMYDAKANLYYDTATAKDDQGNYKQDIYQAAETVNKLLDTMNSAWGILDDSEKKSALAGYQQKLDEIDTYIKARGIEELTKLTPDGISTIEAIVNSTTSIVSAIEALNPASTLDKAGEKTSKDAASLAVSDMMPSILADLASGITYALNEAVVGPLTNTVISSTIDAFNNYNKPTVDPAAEEARKAAADAEQQRINNQIDQNQQKANEALTNLANGTGDMVAVVAGLQGLITTLVNVAKQPAVVSLNITQSRGVEVGIT